MKVVVKKKKRGYFHPVKKEKINMQIFWLRHPLDYPCWTNANKEKKL